MSAHRARPRPELMPTSARSRRIRRGLAFAWILPLCVVASSARAQLRELPNAVVGGIGGVSQARFAGDAHGTMALSGTVLGLTIEVPASELLALRGEVLYHQRGAKQVFVGTAPDAGGTRLPLYQDAHWNYLELDLPVILRPLDRRVHVLVGPGVAMRLSHREEYVQDYQLAWRSQMYPNDTTYDANGILAGSAGSAEGFLLAGIGGTISLGRASLLLEVRYQWGLQDLNPLQSVALYGRSLSFVSGVGF